MKPPGQVGNGENYPSFDSLIAAWTVLSLALAPPPPVKQAHPSLTWRTVIPDTRQRSRFRKHAMPTFREQMPQSASQPRVPTATLIGRFSSIRRACSNDTVRSSRSSTHV
jgi:hypothetical protein